VSNNGHSFFIKLEYADDVPATFIDNGLEVPYIVNSVHFHWGENDQKGSEHKLFGKSYAGEAHVIAYNSKYESLMEAKDKPDGFAVLAVLYEVILVLFPCFYVVMIRSYLS
jgi:carbonic anhydrase